MTLGDHVGQPFFSNKNKAHSRWAGEAGCDSANVSSCWGVIAGDEAVLPHASWISFTSDHLESLFDCDLFAEPSLEASKLQAGLPEGQFWSPRRTILGSDSPPTDCNDFLVLLTANW